LQREAEPADGFFRRVNALHGEILNKHALHHPFSDAPFTILWFSQQIHNLMHHDKCSGVDFLTQTGLLRLQNEAADREGELLRAALCSSIEHVANGTRHDAIRGALFITAALHRVRLSSTWEGENECEVIEMTMEG
jgi:hypothetical protein